MKAILIIGIILAAMIVCGVAVCLCAADEDDLQEWSEDDEQDR
jgi:hypothetical protein